MAEDANETAGGRRRLLVVAATACSAAAIGAAVGPAARVATARGSIEGARPWVRTLRLDALRDGEPKRVMLVADVHDAWTVGKDTELGAAWLVRAGGDVRAYSAVCPHLGCAIDAKAGGFVCPCHDSNFGPDGARIDGPSPRGMDLLATRVEDGVVLVRA